MSGYTVGQWPRRSNDGEFTVGPAETRANIARSMRWCLTSGNGAGSRGDISRTGLAHIFAVFLLEDWIVARGQGKAVEAVNGNNMPRFVDVPLSAEHRADFMGRVYSPDELVMFMQCLCDDGYRIGCTWSGENQSYIVSVTCRNPDSPNNGLCMSSFAKELSTAVALAVYKHMVVTDENWLGAGSTSRYAFG